MPKPKKIKNLKIIKHLEQFGFFIKPNSQTETKLKKMFPKQKKEREKNV
jgi:hypothetical protein